MICDKYDKCTKTDCGMCENRVVNEMTQDLINKINVNVGMAQPIKEGDKNECV